MIPGVWLPDRLLRAYRESVAPKALLLYTSGRWSQLSAEQALLLANSAQNYNPDTKLPYIMHLRWDAIIMIKNLLISVSDQPDFRLDCMQHLVEVQTSSASPPRAATDGLSLAQFEAWTDELASKGQHEARQWL